MNLQGSLYEQFGAQVQETRIPIRISSTIPTILIFL